MSRPARRRGNPSWSTLLVLFIGAVAAAGRSSMAAPGQVDPTFGGGAGIVYIRSYPARPSWQLFAAHLAVDSRDRPVIGGRGVRPPGVDASEVVFRLQENGSPDPLFGGGDGLFTTEYGTPGTTAGVEALALTSSNGVYVGRMNRIVQPYGVEIYQLSDLGERTRTFCTYWAPPFCSNLVPYPWAPIALHSIVEIQSKVSTAFGTGTGRKVVVLSGVVFETGTLALLLTVLRADGSLDSDTGLGVTTGVQTAGFPNSFLPYPDAFPIEFAIAPSLPSLPAPYLTVLANLRFPPGHPQNDSESAANLLGSFSGPAGDYRAVGPLTLTTTTDDFIRGGSVRAAALDLAEPSLPAVVIALRYLPYTDPYGRSFEEGFYVQKLDMLGKVFRPVRDWGVEVGPALTRFEGFEPKAVKIDAKGRILVLATLNGTDRIARLLPSGRPDTSFGVGGVFHFDVRHDVKELAFDRRGRIVVVGNDRLEGGFFVVRITSDFTLFSCRGCAGDPNCGNGTLDDGESCDDGNTADGDCCSSHCRFEDLGGEDHDSDGLGAVCDNCTSFPNVDQADFDLDGVGNQCDADLNNDGVVNFGDLGYMRRRFLTSDATADLNGDGIVNFLDLGLLKQGFFKSPAPSALRP